MHKPFSALLPIAVVVTWSQVALAKETQKPVSGPAKITKLLKAADTNGNGTLSKAEAPEPAKTHFDKIDTNDDGQLDEAELIQAVEDVGRMLKRAIAALPKIKLAIIAQRGQRFRAADTNADGTLSREEAPPLLKQHFDRVDTNKDGQIEWAELRTALGKLVVQCGSLAGRVALVAYFVPALIVGHYQDGVRHAAFGIISVFIFSNE